MCTIVNDYLGTPQAAYDLEGRKVWECELHAYGKVKHCSDRDFIPFRYQGQYEDTETGLYYNRFRYYNPEDGMYLTQDPIGLHGGDRLYSYVKDAVSRIDPFGLFDLFRSMSRDEYHDIKQNGWRGGNNMEGKWFAENHDHAVEWGHQMGHGDDHKFYVVKVEVPDEVAARAFVPNSTAHDGIGAARYLECENLNKHGKITEITSIRCK